MSTYDIYRYIFIIAAVLCGIAFVVSVFLFIYLNIPKIISDLSGATARKAIKNIRENNEKSGEKSHRPSPVNEARGKLTDKISPSGRITPRDHSGVNYSVTTTKIDTQKLPANEGYDHTTVLGNGGETSVLDSYGETSVLDNTGETSVLDNTGETEVLSNTGAYSNESEAGTTLLSSAFIIEYEITYIHTNEIITEVAK